MSKPYFSLRRCRGGLLNSHMPSSAWVGIPVVDKAVMRVRAAIWARCFFIRAFLFPLVVLRHCDARFWKTQISIPELPAPVRFIRGEGRTTGGRAHLSRGR